MSTFQGNVKLWVTWPFDSWLPGSGDVIGRDRFPDEKKNRNVYVLGQHGTASL